ncbi:MAG: response regulator [Burkholderiales bacterium]|nr:response regulator [Burkholderiales bacterium]
MHIPETQRANVADTRVHILVVDNEATHLHALCESLNEQGYVTAGFREAKAALIALRGSKFDALLTVSKKPDIDGIELLHSALKIDPHLAVIVMTSEDTVTSAVEAMRVGAMDCIAKPFGISEIHPVLTRALAVNQLRKENLLLEQRRRAHTAELETTNKQLEAFGLTISHDLRAPLRAIAGFAELLAERSRAELPPESQHYLDFIIKKTDHMQQLLTDLLHFYQLGQQPLAVRPLSVSALVEKALEDFLYDPLYASTDVIAGDLPACVGDAALLQQVFANLLSNAFKFSSKKAFPRVEIGCEMTASGNTYFVRDNGAGFDMNRAEKLFTVFHRLHGPGAFPGTGGGLAAVKHIIERHHGKVWATSTAGEGSTFYFRLGDANEGKQSDSAASVRHSGPFIAGNF